MPAPATAKNFSSHHIKGLAPVLNLMQQLGFGERVCLEGSGLASGESRGVGQGMTLEQEFRIYRNLLSLSEDALLGLKLGQAFRFESYGILGYALMSAATVQSALETACEFGSLTFSHFRLESVSQGGRVGLLFKQASALPADLLAVYADRDLSAVVNALKVSGLEIALDRVELMHDGQGRTGAYEAYFQCPVGFGSAHNALWFPLEMLTLQLPQPDPEAEAFCKARCRELIQGADTPNSLSRQIRDRLRADAVFPPAESMAGSLGCSVRTLRRRLAKEGINYQSLLDEARHERACELLRGNLPIQQIADLLGYQEPGNFTHAFKRWQGCAPMMYRARLAGGPETGSNDH